MGQDNQGTLRRNYLPQELSHLRGMYSLCPIHPEQSTLHNRTKTQLNGCPDSLTIGREAIPLCLLKFLSFFFVFCIDEPKSDIDRLNSYFLENWLRDVGKGVETDDNDANFVQEIAHCFSSSCCHHKACICTWWCNTDGSAINRSLVTLAQTLRLT